MISKRALGKTALFLVQGIILLFDGYELLYELDNHISDNGNENTASILSKEDLSFSPPNIVSEENWQQRQRPYKYRQTKQPPKNKLRGASIAQSVVIQNERRKRNKHNRKAKPNYILQKQQEQKSKRRKRQKQNQRVQQKKSHEQQQQQQQDNSSVPIQQQLEEQSSSNNSNSSLPLEITTT